MEYRFSHFNREVLTEDLDFHGGPKVGEPMPDFELCTSDDLYVRKSDYLGRRPLLVTFASITCPMTASAGPVLKGLFEEYGDRVDFLTVYVREAHPGDRYPQPRVFGWKKKHAADYKERDQIPWPVAVDDLAGTFHRRLDTKSNAVYLMDPNGIVAFRDLWAGDAGGLREALREITSTYRRPIGERRPRVVPMLRGVGAMDEVLDGPAREDVRRQLPTVYWMSRIAARFRGLSPLTRGVFAVSLLLLGAIASIGVLIVLLAAFL